MLRIGKDGPFMIVKNRDFSSIRLGMFVFDVIAPQFAVENIRFFMPDPKDNNKQGDLISLAGVTSSIVLFDEASPEKQVAEFSSATGENLVISPNNSMSVFFNKQEMVDLEVDDFAYIWFIEKYGVKTPIIQGLIRIL